MGPPLPYGTQTIDDDDVAAVVAAMRSGWLTTGPAVAAFEAALEERVGHHPVVAVSSGTAALHAAYAAVGVRPGTNIVTSPLTFAATATVALHLGAEVRFADVEDGTLLIDSSRVADLIDDRTVAIAPVDFAGQPADVEALRTHAEDVDAVVIEDAAHSIGASVGGRPVGDLADLTTFSFHPVKTVTTGEGGAVVVRDSRFLDGVRRFRSHGLVREGGKLLDTDEGPWHQEVQCLGLNYRLSDILAALGTSQLRKLDLFVARRAELVARYRELLGNVPSIRLPEVRTGTSPAWHLFTVRVPAEQRRTVVEGLRASGIGAQVHYLPVYRHPWFREHGYANARCPVADAAYRELVSLPLHPSLAEDDQDRVVAELGRLLRQDPRNRKHG
jgi:UDP-4-amino-4,6-dideoxy-N-acetyl-beta-L-altrosamine transaminase